MTEPTTDIKDTFIAETLAESFARFESALEQRIKDSAASGLAKTASGIQSPQGQCNYKLDANAKTPLIRVMIMNEQGEAKKREFFADAVGTGILKMRLVWREKEGNQEYSSEELAEFCFNELLTPVA
jgi:hypothetical protein